MQGLSLVHARAVDGRLFTKRRFVLRRNRKSKGGCFMAIPDDKSLVYRTDDGAGTWSYKQVHKGFCHVLLYCCY